MSRLRQKVSGSKAARGRRATVRLGQADATLTGVAGLACVDELVGALGLVSALDSGIGAVKSRARGATAGQLLTGLAAAQWCGAQWLAGCDSLR